MTSQHFTIHPKAKQKNCGVSHPESCGKGWSLGTRTNGMCGVGYSGCDVTYLARGVAPGKYE